MTSLFLSLFHRDRKTCQIDFWLIYVISIVFNFHGLLVAYSSSTFMEQFATPEVIGALYTISSCLSVLAFLFISRILKRVGNVRLTLWLAIFEMIALIALGITGHQATAIVAFVAFNLLNPLIYLTIDIFSETLIGPNEDSTGSKRGLTLTLMSVAAAAAPLTMGFIVGDNDTNLNLTYLVAAAVLFMFIGIIVSRFYCFTDPSYKEVQVLSAISGFWHKKNIRSVFLASLNLQFFFAWTMIYIPLYMATEIGLSWEQIGVILAVALSAYIIFEWPVGYIADTYIGEKEMMAAGFVILSVTSACITFMTEATVWYWMVLMFVSRAGASLVEATTESYFFKHVKGTDANIMSFFRLTRPLGLILGSLVGSVSLLYFEFSFIFIILALFLLPGIFLAANLRDTK